MTQLEQGQQRFVKSDKEMIAVKQELDAATAATLETKGYFIQKLAHTDRELASAKWLLLKPM